MGHLAGCARGVGLEKALAVRQGIERVYYAKDMITVRVRCGSFSDGKDSPNETNISADSKSTPPPSVMAHKSEGPAPELGTDPSLKLERMQMVEKIERPPTWDVYFANTGHSYWANFRLTGAYNLRPTL